uniref:Uncharacterized protein n=1 Tax=Rhizophora mucronata TaxID=61149 RepID=A0A2P2NQ01_RHIMU
MAYVRQDQVQPLILQSMIKLMSAELFKFQEQFLCHKKDSTKTALNPTVNVQTNRTRNYKQFGILHHKRLFHRTYLI